ncbi:MAG: hypothetical protein HY906_21255 [Deltaproteobacteria bacterium]|nr:hypothetical protein [Deltaproteobacteria bacterium]
MQVLGHSDHAVDGDLLAGLVQEQLLQRRCRDEPAPGMGRQERARQVLEVREAVLVLSFFLRLGSEKVRGELGIVRVGVGVVGGALDRVQELGGDDHIENLDRSRFHLAHGLVQGLLRYAHAEQAYAVDRVPVVDPQLPVHPEEPAGGATLGAQAGHEGLDRLRVAGVGRGAVVGEAEHDVVRLQRVHGVDLGLVGPEPAHDAGLPEGLLDELEAPGPVRIDASAHRVLAEGEEFEASLHNLAPGSTRVVEIGDGGVVEGRFVGPVVADLESLPVLQVAPDEVQKPGLSIPPGDGFGVRAHELHRPGDLGLGVVAGQLGDGREEPEEALLAEVVVDMILGVGEEQEVDGGRLAGFR